MKTIYTSAKAATKDSAATTFYIKTPEDQLLEKVASLEEQVAELVEKSNNGNNTKT